MAQHDDLEGIFKEHKLDDFRWIDPRKIVLGQWVRMKCRFGCGNYATHAVCPPNAPSFEECERFFGEYREAAIFHFTKTVEKPEDRYPWTKTVNNRLLKLERSVFLAGHQKAFVLLVDPCAICDDCPPTPADCKHPKEARPSPEALCIDVFSTVRVCGFPIQVLSGYSQEMNRYGILLVE